MEFLSLHQMCNSNLLDRDILCQLLYWMVMDLLHPQDRYNQSYSYRNNFKASLPRYLSGLIMTKMG